MSTVSAPPIHRNSASGERWRMECRRQKASEPAAPAAAMAVAQFSMWSGMP